LAASIGWPMLRNRSARRYSECRSISVMTLLPLPGQRREHGRPSHLGTDPDAG
jgi:hypothetical protein